MSHVVAMPTVGTTVNERLLQVDNKLIRMAEHIADFLKDGQKKRPRAWRDLVKYGSFVPFQGEQQTTNIFRGSIGEQYGLDGWLKAEASRRGVNGGVAAHDRGTYAPKTYDWAIESLGMLGPFTRSWKSPTVAVYDFMTADKAKEQFAMILKAGEQVVSDTREVFQREMYMYFASKAGRCLIASEGFNEFVDSTENRFTFDPFYVDSDGDQVIMIPASKLSKVSTLSWSWLDFLKSWLTEECPDAAIGTDSGMPVFGAMLDKNEFEKMVYNDANLREDFRFAMPQALIKGFDMNFKVYRGIALMHDSAQPRWDVKSIKPAATDPATPVDMAVLKRVAPQRLGRTVAIGRVPEANPEYLNAEFGFIVMYIKDVYSVLVPPVITSLGSGMNFGPAPGYNGQWTWLNIRDAVINPLNEIGHFFCRFEYRPKPEENAMNPIVVLYRRCPHTVITTCALDTKLGAPALTSATAVESIAIADGADTSATSTAFAVTLSETAALTMGQPVTLTDASSNAFSGYIASTSAAPTYVVMGAEAVSAFNITDTPVTIVKA